jgi:hypothetical protein
MVLMACERTEHTGLQRALTAMLAERTPRLRWNKQREWKPLLKCPLMKAFVLRHLSEMKPSKLDGTYRRVADAYTNSLSLHLPSAPQFELAAPQPQRDASLKAMRAWLAE